LNDGRSEAEDGLGERIGRLDDVLSEGISSSGDVGGMNDALELVDRVALKEQGKANVQALAGVRAITSQTLECGCRLVATDTTVDSMSSNYGRCRERKNRTTTNKPIPDSSRIDLPLPAKDNAEQRKQTYDDWDGGLRQTNPSTTLSP
jgi:hypothetical protein